MPNEATRAAYRRLFLTPEGGLTADATTVMMDLEALCYGRATTLPDRVPADPIRMAFNEGMRAAYLAIRRSILAPVEDTPQ